MVMRYSFLIIPCQVPPCHGAGYAYVPTTTEIKQKQNNPPPTLYLDSYVPCSY